MWPGSATVGAAKEPAVLTVKRTANLQIFFHVVLATPPHRLQPPFGNICPAGLEGGGGLGRRPDWRWLWVDGRRGTTVSDGRSWQQGRDARALAPPVYAQFVTSHKITLQMLQFKCSDLYASPLPNYLSFELCFKVEVFLTLRKYITSMNKIR